MSRFFVRAAVAIVLGVGASSASGQLLYSFEDGVQGFGPNGFPAPVVAQDTIGATQGTQSLRFALSQAETFSGALTTNVNPAVLLSPDTTDLMVDVTITPEGEFTGAGFANMGITYFGHTPPNTYASVQGATERNIDLAPGTYTLTFPLNALAGGPLRDRFGTDAGDLAMLTGLQFFINKSATDDLTVYLDNIRAIPEPASAFAFCALGGLLLSRRRR